MPRKEFIFEKDTRFMWVTEVYLEFPPAFKISLLYAVTYFRKKLRTDTYFCQNLHLRCLMEL